MILTLAMQRNHRNVISQTSHIHLAELQSKIFSTGFRIPCLISLLLVAMKAGDDNQNLPFKVTEEDKAQIQEVKDLSACGCYTCCPLEGGPISQRAIMLSALAAIGVLAPGELRMSRRASYAQVRFSRLLRSLGEMLGAAPAGSSRLTDPSSYGPCIFCWLLHPCLFRLLMEIHKLSAHPVIGDSVGGLVALSVTVVMI